MDDLTPQEQAEFDSYRESDTQPEPQLEEVAAQPEEHQEAYEQEDQDNDGKKPNHVPVKVLQETRGKFKAQKAELEEALATERQARAQLQAQMEELIRAVNGQSQQDEQLPKLDEDPLAVIGYTAESVKELKKGLEEKAKVLEAIQNELSARQAKENFTNEVNIVSHRFEQARAKNPDFDNAANFLYEQLYREAKVVDPNLDDAAFQKSIAMELLATQREADKRGLDIAGYIYNIAKARGYSGNTQEINGAQSARTLTSSTGKTVGAGVDIANMSEKELMALSEEDIYNALRY